MDLIERQAVIDAFDALCDRECEYSKQQRSFMCGACRLGSAFDVIDVLPSAQPEHERWIPCEERVPEDDTPVLVYLFEHNKSPYIAWLSDGRWYTEDFEVERENEPVAWMPLPGPYEMNEEAQDENND